MRKPSPSMIVALVALFAALSGVGLAANGGQLILGRANGATLNTVLSAPVAGGKALQVSNYNTANAASTALGLNVAAGHAPFAVNSGVKVANLNADMVDGVDSSGFLGSGRVKKLFYDDIPGNGIKTLTTIGPYTLKADCTNYKLSVYANGPAGTTSYNDFVDGKNRQNISTIAANTDSVIFPQVSPAPSYVGYYSVVAGTAMVNTGQVVVQVDYFGTAQELGVSEHDKCTLYGTATMGT